MMQNQEHFKNILPKRPENSHKGTFGHVLNIAGSEFYTGAAYFSSIAPLKVGCGRITLASVEPVLRAVSTLCPDIILMPVAKLFSNKGFQPLVSNFQVVSIGCGFSQSKEAVKIFKKVIKLLENSEILFVIDAEGLDILSRHCETKNVGCVLSVRTKQRILARVSTLPNKTIKYRFVRGRKLVLARETTLSRAANNPRQYHTHLPTNTILTPHPKEMERLMGVSIENILKQPEFWVKECCEKYNCTTVLKLHKTLVADNKGNFYENNTGNSALSHGGSGDVLCGMISGLLAQGVKIFDACCLAVYLHGLAGELASKDLTEYSTLASDLINYIPQAIKTII